VLQVDPSWDVILAGIAFHQWADIRSSSSASSAAGRRASRR
jgi:hypothetical protein